jgi:hypothetical protein
MAELGQSLGPRQRRDRPVQRRRQHLPAGEISHVMHPALGLLALAQLAEPGPLCPQRLVHVRSVLLVRRPFA